MADPKDGETKKRPLIADLLFDDDDDEPGTVPSLDVSEFVATRASSSGLLDPPTQPIDLSGFQELPLPVAVQLPHNPVPVPVPVPVLPDPVLSSPPVRLPLPQSPLTKELSGRNSGIRVLPPMEKQPAVTQSPPPPLRITQPPQSVQSRSLLEPAPVSTPPSSPQPFAALLQEERAPLPKSSGPIAVALPGSVLVIDDDTKAGSLIASRLLELGYTARVARWDQARTVLEDSRFDAAIAEIAADDVRLDGGRARTESLGAAPPPLVLTSSAVFRVDQLRELSNVAGAITKPFFVEVLVQSIESARVKAPAPQSVRAKKPMLPPVIEVEEPTSGEERRGAERFELDTNVVRATISGGPDQGAIRGRLRNLSLTGGLMIESASKVQPKTAITAELTLYDGRMLSFQGRVVRAGARQEIALKLEADDAQRAFLQRFLDDARAPDGRALQPVRISIKDDSLAITGQLDETALMKRWLEVSERLDEDDVQQRFIQECLKAEKLEFAVARYRDLKNARPDDERVAKYLLQIGTILSFKAFGKKDDIAPTKMPGSMKMVIGFFVIAAIALLYILVRAVQK